jgi:hypothetical protein
LITAGGNIERNMKISLLIPLIVAFSCTSIHYISKDSLISQIEKNADTVFILGYNNGIFKAKNNIGTFYFNAHELDSEMLNKIENSSNNQTYWHDLLKIKNIECQNNKNENVLIDVDYNSQLIFIDSLNNKTKMYLRSTIYYDSLFVGYRSLILRIKRKINYNKIKQVQIYSEFKSEKKLN